MRTYLDHAATAPLRPEVAEQVAREQIPVIRDYRDPMVLELLEIS